MKLVLAALLGLLACGAIAQSNPVLEAARDAMVEQNDQWYEDGEYLMVVQNLRTLCEDDPADEGRWSDLIWMLGNVEAYDDQVAAATLYREKNPTKLDAAYYLAQFYFFKRAYARVPELMEPVIKLDPPPHPNCFRFLTNSYQRMGYLDDAVRVLDAHLRAYPEDASARAKREGIKRDLAEKR